VNAIDQRLDELKDLVAQIEHDRDSLREEIARLKTGHDALKTEVERLTAETERPKAEAERMKAEADRLKTEIDLLRTENAGLSKAIDLCWRADQQAIESWQKKTGKTMPWPDRSDMVQWLIGQLDAKGAPSPQKADAASADAAP